MSLCVFSGVFGVVLPVVYRRETGSLCDTQVVLIVDPMPGAGVWVWCQVRVWNMWSRGGESVIYEGFGVCRVGLVRW